MPLTGLVEDETSVRETSLMVYTTRNSSSGHDRSRRPFAASEQQGLVPGISLDGLSLAKLQVGHIHLFARHCTFHSFSTISYKVVARSPDLSPSPYVGQHSE